MYPVRLIQHIDELLLNLLVQLVIQGINLHGLGKNLLKPGTDCRNRVGNNRKAALLSLQILVAHLPHRTHLMHAELLLLLIIMKGFLSGLR